MGIIALVLIFVVAIIMAAPLTWFLMLFLGNLGINISFFGCIPGAFVLGIVGAHSNNGSS